MNSSVHIEENFSGFVIQLRKNDREAWKALDFVLQRVLKNWLRRKVGNNILIEEIYQISLTKFLVLLETSEFENFHKLKSFIFSIAEKTMKEVLRNNTREERLHEDKEDVKNIYAFIEEKDVAALIENHLNSQEKKILVEYFHHGNPLKNIAAQLNITEENCRVIKHRALKKLKSFL